MNTREKYEELTQAENHEQELLASFDKPKRYKTREVNGMDVIDLCKHWNLNFNEGNMLKYLLRDKGEDLLDMEKIADYANRELNHLK
tara:strand:- start:257 stop:517 length:261 start_codon:yes stop_codon:yes gene_type:complete